MSSIEELLRRQKALGAFGDFVLGTDDLQAVLDEACRLVARALDTELAKVLQIDRADDTALVRAGVGWKPGVVGHARVSLSERSSEAYAIALGEPVISADVSREERFHFPDFLKDHGVIALVNVPIFVPGRTPWGVLQVDAREARTFAQEDVEFLKTYAMVLGPVVDRLEKLAGLHRSEDKYRTLFDSIDEGFSISEMIYDDHGGFVDIVFREVNRAFARHTGVSDVIGRSMFDVVPGFEDHWLETYKRVAMSGEPQRVENYQEDLDRWFDVYFSRVDSKGRFVATVFNDVSDRKRAEAELREREKRQTFLLRFSDNLRSHADADHVADRALRMVTEELQLDRCYLATYRLEDDRADITHQLGSDRFAPMPAMIRLSDFPEALRVTFDGTLVVHDLASDPRLSAQDRQNMHNLGFGALLAATVRRGPNYPVWVLVAASAERRRWSGTEISLVEEAAERTWSAIERARADAAIRESEKWLQVITDNVPAMIGYYSRDLRYRWLNPEHARFFGVSVDAMLGRKLEDWLAPHVFARLKPALDRALSGERVTILDCEPDKHGPGHPGWTEETYIPHLGADGEVLGLFSLVIDLTATKRSEYHRQTLLAELQHRVRNILAVVRSIIRRTHDGDRNAEDYVQHLEGRIAALARTQVLLTRGAGARIDLEGLIREELLAQAVREDQVRIRGPEVFLGPKVAEVLTLAVHELATNATKYGAFSRPEGRLAIGWSVAHRDGQDWVTLEWTESGVPVVAVAPMRRGFGAELISRRIPYELKGHGSLELRPGGVRSVIAFPLVEGTSILQTDGVHA